MSELSREARDLIESTLHADDPSDGDRARVRARLAAQLGAVAVAATVGATSSTVVSASSGGAGAGALSAPAGAQGLGSLGLLKIAVVAGLASVVGTVAWFAQKPQEIASGGAAASAEPVETAALPQPASGAVHPIVEPVAAEVEPAVRAQVGRDPESTRAPAAPRRPVEAQPQNESSLADELALLAKAQKALRDGEPAQALTHAHEHRQRIPRGTLREERYGIEALARCALGEDGAQVVAALTRLSPSSPLLGRVRAACEQKP